LVYFREEINTSNLLLFLDETEGLLQKLITRDKQLKDIEMKVKEKINILLIYSLDSLSISTGSNFNQY
jgi:hypothetical protein